MTNANSLFIHVTMFFYEIARYKILRKDKISTYTFTVLDFASTFLHVFVNVTSFPRFKNDITSGKV